MKIVFHIVAIVPIGFSIAANIKGLYHQPHTAEQSNRDSEVNSEKDR